MRVPAWVGWRHVPLWALLLEGGILVFWFRVVDRGMWRPRHAWGLALVLPGAVIWTLARMALGDAFTGRAEARELVTHGPYARLRHPIYVSAELLSAGVLTFLGQYRVLCVPAAVAVPIQVLRARREERVLEAAFGDAYRAYRRRTWC